MVLPNQNPQYWDTYLPQPGDYETAQEYTDALAAGAEDTSDPYGRYYDPIAGVWRGGRRTEREIALSQYDADRYLNPNNSFNKGPYAAMRLQNRISNNPDAARLAYHAYDEFGNPLIDPAILAVIEQQLGIGAYEPPVAGGPGAGGGDIPYNPDNPTLPKLGAGEMPGGGDNPDKPRNVGDPFGGVTIPPDPWTPGPTDRDPTDFPAGNPPPIGTQPPGGGPGSDNTNGERPPFTPGPTYRDPTDFPAGNPPNIGETPPGSGPGSGNTGMEMLSALTTINPLYPDFMLQGGAPQPPRTTADRLGLRNRRIPLGGLGAY